MKFTTQEASTALSRRTNIDNAWTHVTDAGKLDDDDPYHFYINSEGISEFTPLIDYNGGKTPQEVAYNREIALTGPVYYTRLAQNNTYRVRYYDSSNGNTETALGDKKKVKMSYLETVSNDPVISNGTVTPTGMLQFSEREISGTTNDSIYLTKGGYVAWIELENPDEILPYATIKDIRMQGVSMNVKAGDATEAVSSITVYPWAGSEVLILATTATGKELYLKFNGDDKAPETMAVNTASMTKNARFFIDYATKFKVPLNYMKTLGDDDYSWGTICVPYDLKIKGNGQNSAKVYTVEEVVTEEGKKKLTLTEVTGETLTAGTPYILRSIEPTKTLLATAHPNSARNVEMQVVGSYAGAQTEAGSTAGKNVELRGQYLRFKVQGSATDESIYKESDKYYTLGTGGGKGIGFYPYAHQNKQYSIGPNKAYIYKELTNGDAGVRMMTMQILEEMFENDVVTAIDAIEATNEGGDWYTVEGIKVAKPTMRGIYIRNGKKIVIK